MKANTFGVACEIVAMNYLRKLGYDIIQTNYKNKIGEIDIIAKDQDVTVFVEVKGRASRLFGDPLEAINNKKQIKIRNVASVYMIKNKLINAPVRFDAISVLGETEPEVHHIKGAF